MQLDPPDGASTQLEGLDPEVSGPRGHPGPGPPGPAAPKPLGPAASGALPDPVGCASQHDRLKWFMQKLEGMACKSIKHVGSCGKDRRGPGDLGLQGHTRTSSARYPWQDLRNQSVQPQRARGGSAGHVGAARSGGTPRHEVRSSPLALGPGTSASERAHGRAPCRC